MKSWFNWLINFSLYGTGILTVVGIVCFWELVSLFIFREFEIIPINALDNIKSNFMLLAWLITFIPHNLLMFYLVKEIKESVGSEKVNG